MKNLFVLLLSIVMIHSGCQKLNELFTFEIPNSQNITIPASTIINVPLVSPVPVTMNSEQSFESHNTNSNLVKDVRLSRLSLTITDPATENFDFLQSIKLSIGTNQNDKVLLASLDSIPAGVSTINLKPGDSKLDEFIKRGSYTIYTEVSIKSNVSNELTVRADSWFKVTADPL